MDYIKWMAINWKSWLGTGAISLAIGFLIGLLIDMKIRILKEDFRNYRKNE